jgi:hypothetical protein
MVYTSKLLVFVSNVGADIVDIIPMSEIASINAHAEDAPKANRRASAFSSLEDDNDSDAGPGEESSPISRAALELSIATVKDGYNSGRSYRVSSLILETDRLLTCTSPQHSPSSHLAVVLFSLIDPASRFSAAILFCTPRLRVLPHQAFSPTRRGPAAPTILHYPHP